MYVVLVKLKNTIKITTVSVPRGDQKPFDMQKQSSAPRAIVFTVQNPPPPVSFLRKESELIVMT